MTLSPGTRFGAYLIQDPVGAGGMGEVYRAHDTRLGRDVALKVLPAEFARDPDRVRRFEREAHVLASLNHPNIAAIYGFEQADGLAALALELVEGPTLADRLQRGALTQDEALSVARQICSALAVAHDQGIVHRDLKPANIKLRPDGAVKVLDFGIAKAGALDSENVQAAPTVTATRAGTVMGTAAYMSPEQARGLAVDKRTDLWAFGCVLFEMLTGKAAFTGATTTDVLVAVIGAEPQWKLLPGETPGAVRRVLTRCLRKDAALRLRDASDAALDLGGLDEHPTPSDRGSGRAPVRWAAIGTGLLALVALAFAAGRYRNQPGVSQGRPVAHFTFTVADVNRLGDSRIALSPDGSRVAYTAVSSSSRVLYIQDLGEEKPRIISNLPEATEPFFSPDGAWVGVHSAGQLHRVDVATGLSQIVCAVQGNVQGGAWTPDGSQIVFAQSGRLLRVPATGGDPIEIVAIPNRDARFPFVLPGGTSLLYAEFDLGVGGPAQIVAHDLTNGHRELLEKGDDARYLPTGDIVFVRDEALFVAPFDTRTLKLAGPAFPVLQGVEQTTIRGGVFSVSDSSQIVYARGLGGNRRRLVSVDRTGAITPLDVPPRNLQTPRVSPDGTKVLFEDLVLPHSVWIFERASGLLSKLAPPDDRHNPIWSWDGSRILFNRLGAVYATLADGSGPEERVVSIAGRTLNPHSWSPGGRVLALSDLIGNDRNVWVQSISPAGEPQPLVNTPALETMPQFSPDGQWIAYVSNASGRNEVYVRSFLEPGGLWQVSTEGGVQPVWARSGRELFYRSGDTMMAVDVAPGRVFNPSRRRALFKTNFALQLRGAFTDYDIFPNGQHFVMVEELNPAGSAQLHFVTEWFEELKRLAPASARR